MPTKFHILTIDGHKNSVGGDIELFRTYKELVEFLLKHTTLKIKNYEYE